MRVLPSRQPDVDAASIIDSTWRQMFTGHTVMATVILARSPA